MASCAGNSRQRKRKRCRKCNQELSHSAYTRHMNPAVCPEVQSSHEDEGTVISPADSLSCNALQEKNDDNDEVNVDTCENEFGFISNSSSESSSESEIESQEYISGSEEVDTLLSDQEDGVTAREQSVESMKLIAVQICMFISFFQLCYRVSERGISLLLCFLKTLLSWIGSFCPEVKTLHDVLPGNVYFMRKLLGRKSEITCFVVCPKCHSLYTLKDCIITRRNGMTESAKCSFVQYPNHPQLFRRTKCNTFLLKMVKHGSKSKLIPRAVYAYKSLELSLAKLCNQPAFVEKCNLWRSRTNQSPDYFTDVYDGKVWHDFQVLQGRPFLLQPNNLCLKLNLDWFNPFKHVQYSVGVLYLVVENLPRADRYKLENIIIVGCIPGPKEPKKNINTYLRPLVDELLGFWQGKYLRVSSAFGIMPVRCALTCITCDLPATRKICGFLSFCASQGCSKCRKNFPCSSFGEKLNYSGYDRDLWPSRTHAMHMQHVSEVQTALTATRQSELEKQYGVRYSELLRLPYLDIIEHHVVDPMHNFLLGTAKHVMSLWKEKGVIDGVQLESIQDKVDRMRIPSHIGRIPHKIASNFSSFTADQWRNWICVYSLYCLHGVLPPEHFSCWALFVDACSHLLQPSISCAALEQADKSLIEFCKAFESLYGEEHCTPNMHMHLHVKQSVLNYGPVYGFWCFPFERFNGILGSFQKNWVSPELQMFRKFLTYQDLLLSNVPSSIPQELREFFQFQLGVHDDISVSEGSVEQSHIDPLSLSQYQKNAVSSIPCVDATLKPFFIIHRRYEKFFNHEQVSWLTQVYSLLYPNKTITHVPMFHETFNEVNVLGERLLSKGSKGSHSALVCAYWPRIGGTVSQSCEILRVGVVQHFLRHTVEIESSSHETTKVAHMFAFVHWYRVHPRATWFHPRIIVVSPDMIMNGPAVFLPISRIYAPCAMILDDVHFDYGVDHVPVVVILFHKFCN